jgi:hypothetical protein
MTTGTRAQFSAADLMDQLDPDLRHIEIGQDQIDRWLSRTFRPPDHPGLRESANRDIHHAQDPFDRRVSEPSHPRLRY